MLWQVIHPYLFPVFAVLFCVWISSSLMTHMWFEHRRDPIFKKLAWSIILCLPFFGWLFYLGMYTPLRENDVRISPDPTVFTGPLQ